MRAQSVAFRSDFGAGGLQAVRQFAVAQDAVGSQPVEQLRAGGSGGAVGDGRGRRRRVGPRDRDGRQRTGDRSSGLGGDTQRRQPALLQRHAAAQNSIRPTDDDQHALERTARLSSRNIRYRFSFRFVCEFIALAASCRKRNVSVWRPSVRPSVRPRAAPGES